MFNQYKSLIACAKPNLSQKYILIIFLFELHSYGCLLNPLFFYLLPYFHQFSAVKYKIAENLKNSVSNISTKVPKKHHIP